MLQEKGDAMQAPQVLVIEDDPEILDLIELYLRRDGLRVSRAETGQEGLRLARLLEPDLVVLDLMLPDVDGYEVCRQLVAQADTPVLIVTARGDVTDRVLGFRSGAEDYVVKPFAPEELLFRVRALLRRSGRWHQAHVVHGPFHFDGERMRLTVNQEEVSLTRKELEVLQVLASRPGYPFTRGQLLQSVWGYGSDVDDRAVDTCVTRLRRKLFLAFRRARTDPVVAIETVWGIGYRFSLLPLSSAAPGNAAAVPSPPRPPGEESSP
jgi:DNA-binding response OmpR family regulator